MTATKKSAFWDDAAQAADFWKDDEAPQQPLGRLHHVFIHNGNMIVHVHAPQLNHEQKKRRVFDCRTKEEHGTPCLPYIK